ncbi:hypothetical protein IJT93_11280, partial [bacterium]|nr:hypothetical protein [bacterium]
SGPAHDSTELSEEEKSDSLFRKLYSPPAHSDSFDIKYHLAGFILMLLGAACIHGAMGSATFSHIAAGDAAKGSLLNAAGLLLTAVGLLAQLYAALIKKAHKTEIFTHIPSEAFIPHLPAQVAAVILHSCACLYLLFRLFPLICRQNSLMPAAVAFIAAGTAIAILCALAAFKSRKLDEILILLTLSQWGTVIMTLGLGSMTAACFHTASVSLAALLLFMATGSVVIRSGSQSLGAVGSLRDTMFYTWMACVFGGLSWLGLPPLLGFFSIYGLLGFTFNYSMLTLAAFAVIFLVQAVHAFVLVKVYCLTFESEAPAKDSDREVPSEEIGPGLWVLPLALNSLLLALGLTDIPYAWQLPLPSIYEDFMQTAELRASGSPWLPIVIYLPCCCAAMYMSFRAYIKSGGKFIISDKAEQLLDKCRSILPLTDN